MENVAASELQIVLHRNDHSTDSTTFAGGKYLHINPSYETIATNNSSAGADMEYDESTGVLKLYDTDNMLTYDGDLSLYGLNSSDLSMAPAKNRRPHLFRFQKTTPHSTRPDVRSKKMPRKKIFQKIRPFFALRNPL